MGLIRTLKRWHKRHKIYAILDPKDNSVTFSKALFNLIKMNTKTPKATVFVFKLKGTNTYAFTTQHEFSETETQTCDIQYNSKYNTIGFETLCPSVGQILYAYGLPHDQVQQMPVLMKHTSDGIAYYQIERP